MDRAALHVFDYIIIVTLFLTSLGIGIFFGIRDRKRQTREEYFLGRRHMNMFSVCVSIFVTYMSAVSLMGFPAEVYSYGGFFVMTAASGSLSYFLGLFTVVPLFYGLKISVYEYLEHRYKSKAVRFLGASLGICTQIMYTSVTLLAPALALQTGADLPIWVSVVVVGIVGTVYTSMGGFKSVIWNDVFQAVVMGVGLVAVLVRGLVAVGGAGQVWELGNEGGRLDFNQINPDPRVRHTYWTILLGATVNFFSFTFGQSTVQRTCSIRSLREAKITYMMTIPLVIVSKCTLCFTGLLVYAYFHSIKCDPFKAGHISNRNEIMPYFVMHVLVALPGFAGLYIATLFSASLTTFSSFVNALSANMVEDVLKFPLQKFKVTEKMTTVIAKISVCFFGALTMGLVYIVRTFPGTVTQTATSILGAIGGPLTGMFCLGATFPGANKYGAIVGGVTAIITNVWIALGKRLYGKRPQPLPFAPSDNCEGRAENQTLLSHNQSIVNTTLLNERSGDSTFFLYDMSYFYFALLGIVVCMIVGILVSKCTKSLDPGQPDPSLMFPFARRLWGIHEPSLNPDGQAYISAESSHTSSHMEEKKTNYAKKHTTIPALERIGKIVISSWEILERTIFPNFSRAAMAVYFSCDCRILNDNRRDNSLRETEIEALTQFI